MSETSLGPGWWQASDGKWYDPCVAAPAYVPTADIPPDRDNGLQAGTNGQVVRTDSPLSQVVELMQVIGQPGRAPSGDQGFRAWVTSRGRLGVSFGRLGMVLMGFVYLMVAALFILLAGVVIGGFLLALLIVLMALGIHRLLLLTTGRHRARRAVPWPFQPVSEVIDVTDTALRNGTSQHI